MFVYVIDYTRFNKFVNGDAIAQKLANRLLNRQAREPFLRIADPAFQTLCIFHSVASAQTTDAQQCSLQAKCSEYALKCRE